MGYVNGMDMVLLSGSTQDATAASCQKRSVGVPHGCTVSALGKQIQFLLTGWDGNALRRFYGEFERHNRA